MSDSVSDEHVVDAIALAKMWRGVLLDAFEVKKHEYDEAAKAIRQFIPPEDRERVTAGMMALDDARSIVNRLFTGYIQDLQQDGDARED